MLSVARSDANAKNAQRSTGPRTVAGIERSSANALRHGLTATAIVVIDAVEDRSEYESLLDAIVRDLDAQGPVETLLAERVAQLFWRLRRVVRFETERLTQCQAEMLPSASQLSERVQEQAERDRTLNALGALFLPEDRVLDDANVVVIVDVCLSKLTEKQRMLFLGGSLESVDAIMLARRDGRHTVRSTLDFIHTGERRLATLDIGGTGRGSPAMNLLAEAYAYCAGADRQWQWMSPVARRGYEKGQTQALLLQIEHSGVVERYEPRLRRDLSRTLRDLYELQSRRGRGSLPIEA